jgi:hypothetical protein
MRTLHAATSARVGLWLGLILGAPAVFAIACETAAPSCIVGAEACRCTSSNACDPGLSCRAGRCLRAEINPTAEAAPAAAPVPVPGMVGPAPAINMSNMAPVPIMPPAPIDPGTPVTMVGPSAGAPRVANGAGPTWTILVYGHGDHNLSPALLRDFGEMNRARLNDNVRVLFLSDWDASAQISAGEESENYPSGALWFRIVGGRNKAELVGEEKELNLDNPAVLARAIELAFRAHPADRYGLVLWDHGGAWLGGFGGDTDDGTIKGRPMSVDSAVASVGRGLTAAGLAGSRRLDFLAFDTCLMAGAEVISAFRESAQVFISNAELDFGDGLDYEATLSWLSEHPAATPAELAVAESRAWDDQHRQASAEDELFRSHAAFDTRKFEAFIAASRGLVTAARSAGFASVARAFYGTVPGYFSGETGEDERRPKLRDFGSILDRLKAAPDPALAEAASRALEAAKAAKLAGASGSARINQLGMHVFAGPIFTLPDQHLSLYPGRTSPWSQATGWADLLTATKAARRTELPVLQGEAVVPVRPSLQDPPAVRFQVSGQDLGKVDAALVQQNPDDDMQLIVNGIFDAAFVSEGGSFIIRWSGRRQMLDARPEPLIVTAQPWLYTLQDQKLTLSFYAIAGLLVVGEEQLPVDLVSTVDGVAAAVVLKDPPVVLTFQDISDLSEEEAIFVPMVRLFDNREMKFKDVPSKEGVYLPARGALRLLHQPVPAGNYAVFLRVEDVWGNGAFNFFPVFLSEGIQ